MAAAAWRGVLRAALALLIAVGLFIHILVREPIPPVIVFMVLFVVALVLLPRSGRARTVGVVIGGLAALLFFLGNLPFVLPDLAHPESPATFAIATLGMIGAFVGLVAMVGALVRRGGGAARPVMIVGGVAAAASIVLGVVASMGVDDDERQPDDAVLLAKDVDYVTPDAPDANEAQVTVEAGGAVFVENKDVFRHTFVVEDLGIEEEMPAGASRRVVIDGEPGTYAFKCDVEGHEEDMRGTLTVE